MIYQNHIEILTELLVIMYLMGLCLNLIVVASFSQEQINKKDTFTGVPGIIYNFNNKDLITFEDNSKSKGDISMEKGDISPLGDIPMDIYFDFYMDIYFASTEYCFDSEQKIIFVMSYVLIVAFHPNLILRQIIVQRRYGHTLQQLTTLDYLITDQMKFINAKLATQLKKTDSTRRKPKKT